MITSRVKSEWKSVFMWLLIPPLLTILAMRGVGSFQEHAKVPIGLVMEDESPFAERLAEELKADSLLAVRELDEDDALHALAQHELDSVFIIKKGYGEHVLAGKRNALITGYSSNRSFAYTAARETVMSLAQEDLSRSKAAYIVERLFNDYGMSDQWDYEKVTASALSRQQEEELLKTRFVYGAEGKQAEQLPLLDSWGAWALFAIISAFFLFDWMIKESAPDMKIRWLYSSKPFQVYALQVFLLYTGLTLLADGLAVWLFHVFLGEGVTGKFLLALLVFRLTMNMFAFLFAIVIDGLIVYYGTGIAVSLLLTVAGGGLIPLDGIQGQYRWIEALSPVQSLLKSGLPGAWLIVLLLLLCAWLWKGGKRIA